MTKRIALLLILFTLIVPSCFAQEGSTVVVPPTADALISPAFLESERSTEFLVQTLISTETELAEVKERLAELEHYESKTKKTNTTLSIVGAIGASLIVIRPFFGADSIKGDLLAFIGLGLAVGASITLSVSWFF